ncbi:MAG: 50S ribosomal protein L18Ae [Desulfurococcaceae archaeon TW002]
MGSEVKTYRVNGVALFSPDKLKFWQKFSLEVRALTKEEALEKVYSLMGSKHKLKRKHIKILDVVEIRPEEAKKRIVKELAKLKGWFS